MWALAWPVVVRNPVDGVDDVVSGQLATVHGRLRVPADAAPELEDVRRLVRLGPRLGEVPLQRERAGLDPRARPVTHESAVRERHHGVELVGDPAGGVQVEVRRIPQPDRERPSALGGLGADRRRYEGGASHRGGAELEQVATTERHGLPPRVRSGQESA
jgi:hypothetical protein